MLTSTLFLALWAYWMLSDRGYGARPFLTGATGWSQGRGCDLPDHPEIILVFAREYMLAAYAFPKVQSRVALGLVVVTFGIFLQRLFQCRCIRTWEPC